MFLVSTLAPFRRLGPASPSRKAGVLIKCYQVNLQKKKKRFLGTSRRRLEDNFLIDLREIFFSARNLIVSAQGGDYWKNLANMTLNLWVP